MRALAGVCAPVCVIHGTIRVSEGTVMNEPFECVDLGDAMIATKCALTFGPFYDYLWGWSYPGC